MAAVSVGLCAKADDTGFISGTSFETLNETDYLAPNGGQTLCKWYNAAGIELSDDDSLDPELGSRYWMTEATDAQLVVSNLSMFAGGYLPNADRPQQWSGGDNTKALYIDTDKPLMRYVHPSTDGNTAVGADLNQDIFFDSVVQFTATDVAAEPDSADKLRVWLYTSPENLDGTVFGEEEAVTRLVVTAGYYKPGDSTTHKTNYLTNVSISSDSWHRLTIKTFVVGGYTKFNIYVDGEIVKVGDLQDFDSLFKVDGQDTLQCVAFDGKGAVDDIVFTTTAPEFAQGGEPTEATYAIAATYNAEHVFVSYYEDDGGTVEIANASAIDIEKATVYAFIEMKDGAELTGVKLNGNSVDIPVMADGGYNILLPLGTPTSGATYTLEISTTKTTGGGSGEEPEDPEDPAKPTIGGVEVVVDDNGKITNITTADNGKAVVGELDTTKFAEYYTVSVTDGVLSIALNPAVATPEINETATDKDDAFTVTDTAVALGVTNAKPGLWYGAQAYSDVACADDDKIGAVTGWVKATTTTVSVTAEKPEASAAFFKVVVDDQDHTTATPPAEQE